MNNKLYNALQNLKRQRQNKIFAIIKEYERYGGKAQNCPIDMWGKNPNYPELYSLECQIDRYKHHLERS